MKKILYTLLSIAVIFSACQKDDEENEINNSLIIGDWIVKEITSNLEQGFYDGGYPNGEKIITYTNEDSDTNDDLLLSFYEDNFTDNEGGSGSYSINGNSLELVFFDSDEPDENNELEIISLTSSELILEMSYEDTMTYYWDSNNDTIYYYASNIQYEFEKSSSISSNQISKSKKNNINSFLKAFIYRKKLTNPYSTPTMMEQ